MDDQNEPGPSTSYKWRSKRDKPRASKPYSRSERPHHQHIQVQEQPQSVLNRVISTVTHVLPEWIKSAANYLTAEIPEAEYETQDPTGEPQETCSGETTSTIPEDGVVASANNHKRQTGVIIERVEGPEEDVVESSAPRVLNSGVEMEDDRSSSSENTASSTSGCSSLVPSHQDHLQRLHLPKDSLDRLRMELMKKSHRPLETLAEETTRGASGTSSAAAASDAERKGLWSSNSMRQFDVSKFLAPSSVINPGGYLMTNRLSPFYEGHTMFGGSGARRPLLNTAGSRLASNSPYTMQRVAPVLRIRASQSKQPTPDKMSAAAKKILESMDKISSPLEEAKRIPVSTHPRPSLFNRTCGPQSLTRTARPESAASPTLRTMVPTVVRDEGHRINWSLELKKSVGVPKTSGVTSSHQLNPAESSSAGGKMMRSVKSSGRISIRNESLETAEIPVLPQVSLPPIRSLPTFNFNNTRNHLETQSDKREFAFSPPIPVRINNAFQDQQPKPCPTNKLPPLETRVETSPTVAPSGPVVVPVVNSESVGNNKSVAADGPVVGKKWWCDTCLVQNESDKTKCVACETPRVTPKDEGLKQQYCGYQFSCNMTQSKPFVFGSLGQESSKKDTQPSTMNKTSSSPLMNSGSSNYFAPPSVITSSSSTLLSSSSKNQPENKNSNFNFTSPVGKSSPFSPPPVVAKDPFKTSFESDLSKEASQNNSFRFNSNSRFH